MLNRRTLRIKAMQAIYAYMQAEGSDYLLALDQIGEDFAPDLNAMEVQDRKLLEGQKQIATLLFKEWYEKRQFDAEDADKEIVNAVNRAIVSYQNQSKKDRRYYHDQMLIAVERIYDHYLANLQLMGVLTDLVKEEEEKRSKRFTEAKGPDVKQFLRNQLVQRILNNKSYQQHIIRRNISWGSDVSEIAQVYRAVIKQDEVFLAYLQNPSPSLSDDFELVKHIYKNIIFKEKTLQPLFEEQDLNWAENKAIVKSLVNKTIKMLGEESEGNAEDVKLLDLSPNWEDDKAFFEELYEQTLQETEKYETMISASVQNWDVERVALLDKIILKMALSEMYIFRSIPVKVTINEYIEISKIYSTPKSKQFINGVLDKMAQELVSKGEIRKSGRGLIDNK
ncbi:transcription antitermination factor NusB [Pontibacter sp. BT310]|uniref:Transcription antitermination factor NusB n=2 Tax=Hymenobacteraceae TaxID=1853232 RepID=A0ABS6X8U5_9BACT|nr:transcription antitermination factor NusB [Pontibacter sp. BT310]MBR0569959.1 transcription antitermination factor NusB [Microvirga sp. STS03]MBW3364387.1 transcription antitermination factor NusB [Pontibacter populi]